MNDEREVTLENAVCASVLLHCHYRTDPPELIESNSVQTAVCRLTRYGAIEKVGENVWRTTKLGKAWVSLLINTPIPTVAFVDANGHVIDV